MEKLPATPTSPSAQRTGLERRHSSPVLMSYQRNPVSNWISVISTIGADTRFCTAEIGKAVSQLSKHLDCDQPDKAVLKASSAALFTLLEKQMGQGEMEANLSVRFHLSQLQSAIECMPTEIAPEYRFSIAGVTQAFANLTKDK